MIQSSRSPIRTFLALLLASVAGLLRSRPRRRAHSSSPSTSSTATASAIPVAVVPFKFEGGGLPPDTDVADVIRDDLNRSGQFRALPKNDIVEYADARRRHQVRDLAHAQAGLHRGRPCDWRVGDGDVRVEFELFDVAKQQPMLGLAISGQRTALRDVAHQVADWSTRRSPACAARSGPGSPTSPRPAPRQQHPVRADGRRFGRLQSADRRALARTADVAGVVAGRPQAGLRLVRARQFVDLHPGNRHRFARGGLRPRASTARRRSRRTAAGWR